VTDFYLAYVENLEDDACNRLVVVLDSRNLRARGFPKGRLEVITLFFLRPLRYDDDVSKSQTNNQQSGMAQ
jgi:hypothetical protein